MCPAEENNQLNEERRRVIVETMQRDGRVLVADLARRFRTSRVTIRKDLEILHVRGLIQRTHGGALPTRGGALEDRTLREKEKLHRKEKLAVAAAAAQLVTEGQVVILDSGTTTTEIARALRNFRNLTIVTNAVNIAAELATSSLEVILSGGTVRKNSFSLVGPIAEETLRRLSADILFLGVDGFDVHYGLSTPNLQEAKVNRVMRGDCQAHGCGLRFQQVRAAQPFLDRRAFRSSPRHYGSWNPQERCAGAEAGGD